MPEVAIDSHDDAEREPVVLAHAVGFPPFADLTPQGSVGVAVEVLRKAAKRAGLNVKMVALPFEELHAAAFDGRVSGIFPVAINAFRGDRFDFSEPLVVSGGGLFTRASDSDETPTLETLAGKIVTTPVAGPLYEIIRQSSPDIRLLSAASYEESFVQLISGAADAAALNFEVGTTMVEQRFAGLVRAPSSTFVNLPMAVAVPQKTSRMFLEKLNRVLRQLRSEGWTGH